MTKVIKAKQAKQCKTDACGTTFLTALVIPGSLYTTTEIGTHFKFGILETRCCQSSSYKIWNFLSCSINATGITGSFANGVCLNTKGVT